MPLDGIVRHVFVIKYNTGLINYHVKRKCFQEFLVYFIDFNFSNVNISQQSNKKEIFLTTIAPQFFFSQYINS